MNLPLAISGLSLALIGTLVTDKPKTPVGTCMPYAEKCLHCVDCTQCKHCAKDHGRCSVCFKK